jgi:hypothetical protein
VTEPSASRQTRVPQASAHRSARSFVPVLYDVADDRHVHIERQMAAALARDRTNG